MFKQLQTAPALSAFRNLHKVTVRGRRADHAPQQTSVEFTDFRCLAFILKTGSRHQREKKKKNLRDLSPATPFDVSPSSSENQF